MGMVVRTNTMAINAYRQLGLNNNAVAKSLEKLASGYRINRAGDDAAGLAISEKMKAQITGLETASANAQDGISLIQTAEGNLSEVHDMLNRMVELATKSANGTYTNIERKALQDEMDQLLEEIDRISKSANFNGAKLLDGSLAEVNAISAENIKTTGATTQVTATGEDLGVEVVSSHVNDENTKDKQEPTFKIDFANVKFEIPDNTSTTATASYKVSLGKINNTAVTFFDSTADLATTSTIAITVAKATNSTTFGTLADQKGADIAGKFDGKYAVIGDAVYSVAKGTGAEGNSKLTFTYIGAKGKDGNFVDKDDASGAGKPTDSMVKPAGDVSVTVEGLTGEERVDCHITDITDPQAGSELKRAGAKLTLTEDMIKAGPLKIGGTTFTFDDKVEAGGADTPTNKTSPGNTSGEVTIGIKGLSGEELLAKVTEQMSHCTMTLKAGDDQDGDEYTFMIGRGADTKTIEIEENFKDGASALDPDSYGKFTEAQLKKAFSQVQAASAAKVEMTLSEKDDEEVNFTAGNTLTVGDKTFTFVEGTADETKNEIAIGSTARDTLANIKTAVAGIKDGTTALYTVDVVGNKLTITNASKTAAAPKVAYTANTVDAGGLTLQIGDTAQAFNKMTVFVKDMSANGLGLEELKKTGIMTEASASKAIDTIKTAINTVSSTRAGLGALQNRLEHTINNLDVAAENLSSANSRIRDTDMAKEMMNYTKMNVLVQSAQAMLAQANQQPQSVLQLLQ